MTFAEKIRRGIPVVTDEIGPPKGADTAKILEEAELVRDKVDALNVTDLQSSVMRLGSLAACAILKQKGFDPILQVTCRDRNRLALQSDILSAASLGIGNLMALTGDYPTAGDHPEAKPVFDLDSVQLLRAIGALQSGADMNGNRLEGPAPKFCLGAAVNPGADPLEPQIIKMEQKVEAGAEFFQTQAVFDPAVFERFLSKIRHLKVPVIAGVVFLKSAAMARYMNKNVAGVSVPDNLIQEMERATDKVETSVAISVRLIRDLKPMCRGIHLMPIGWGKYVPRVLEQAGLTREG